MLSVGTPCRRRHYRAEAARSDRSTMLHENDGRDASDDYDTAANVGAVAAVSFDRPLHAFGR